MRECAGPARAATQRSKRPAALAPAMDIVVFGAGAMGSFFGGLLSRRNRVTLVCRKEHADAIRRSGLRITGKTSLIGHPQVATSIAGGKPAALVLVATKAYDTESAARSLRRFANRATWLTLQNGLDNPEVLARTARRAGGAGPGGRRTPAGPCG